MTSDHPVGWELSRISEELAEGSGAWRTCSGCHELNEGHPTGEWSDVLKCHLGLGCRECGGLGAIWDNTDYSLVNEHPTSSQAMLDVSIERRRQVEAEGWTPLHDDQHEHHELSTAAACYARPDLRSVEVSEDRIKFIDPWPWWNDWDDGGRCSGREKAWWKPTGRRRDLVKAAALIIADIERLDRAATKEN